ncbi:MAG TPA: hypothetical protein VGR91_16245 [Stellaceae bacterium]|nr:hypothetical protein [Stellaceae bacterium]
MTLMRIGFALTLLSLLACSPGGPKRASDIQNLNGISDDISNVQMTQPDALRPADPNLRGTYPKSYELPSY